MFSCHINLVISNHVIYNIKYKCLEYKNFQSVKHKVSNKLGNYSHYNILITRKDIHFANILQLL